MDTVGTQIEDTRVLLFLVSNDITLYCFLFVNTITYARNKPNDKNKQQKAR